MFKAIKRAWNGEEKLWRVFWLWGVPILPISTFIGMISWMSLLSVEEYIGALVATLIALLFVILGLIVILVYPVIMYVAIIRARSSIEYRWLRIIFRTLAIMIFLHIHIGLGFGILIGIGGFLDIVFGDFIDHYIIN